MLADIVIVFGLILFGAMFGIVAWVFFGPDIRDDE